MQTHQTNARQMIQQAYDAQRLMQAYEDYAREIGCHVQGDEIVCNSKQSRLLEAKWDELTGALFDHG